MSRNLLDHARENRDMITLKKAFQSIGCDCDFDDINGAAEAIKNLSTVPTVFNATLLPGPGVKVTPIERKGYKISANSEAQLFADINEKYRRGTSIHNVLAGILTHDLPKAVKVAIGAPRVSDIEVFKVYDDGIDYYNNAYFGRKGQGRKTGLQPCTWYVKIYTTSQVEPLYVSLSPIVTDLYNNLMQDMRREVGKMVDDAIKATQIGEPNDPDSTLENVDKTDPNDWHYQPNFGPHKPVHGCHKPGHCGGHHKPQRPCRPEPIYPEPEDPEENDGPIIYEQPTDPNSPGISYDEPTGCPICDEDKDFGGYAGDDNFGIDQTLEDAGLNDILKLLND